MLNFIASDYSGLAPFQSVSAAVTILQVLYIAIIKILLLNALIAILNLRMQQADKNAANLYHLQMASLQVEIKLGLLSSSERARLDWFPEWFSYTMTETEKHNWEEYVGQHRLKWSEENNFGEEKDHAPLIAIDDEVEKPDKAQPSASSASTIIHESLVNEEASQDSKHSLNTGSSVKS